MTAAGGRPNGSGTSGAAPTPAGLPDPSSGSPAHLDPDEARTEDDGPPDIDTTEAHGDEGPEQAEHAGQVEPESAPKAAGPLSNALAAVAVIGLGVAALLGSWSLGAGSARAPDAGTWPLLVSGVLVALGVALLTLAGRTGNAERFSRAGLLVLAALATMVGFVAALEIIGFEIPAVLLTFVWLRFLGGEGLRTSIVTSVAVVVAFYVVFVGLLGVPVPHMF